MSTTSRACDCCVLAACDQTAGVLLADTELIESLLPRAIKDLIGEKIGPIERERVEEADRNKNVLSGKCTIVSLCVGFPSCNVQPDHQGVYEKYQCVLSLS